jgi:succinoglycan biosynthesis transport protein ExoP
MSIIQFFRILWAYRLLTVVTTIATLIGAGVAVLIVPPSYEASTRVMLNVLKPDPITGQSMAGQAREYLETQRELIKDFGVAGQAVDQLGWTSLPETLQGYTAAGSPDGGIRRWLAQSIIAKTKTDVVGNTNILEISFRAATPTQASSMANALRDAYIESTISGRRREAMRNAEWFTQQADKERQLLDAADQKKTAYEKETGIVMADEKTDIETSRLRSLSSQTSAGAPIIAAPMAPATSASAMQLAQLDAQIAQASKSLGANHPAMIEMHARRATLAKMAVQEQAAAREAMMASARAAGAGVGALDRAVAAQTSRVVAQRDKIQHLTQLQQDVNQHRETIEKSLGRAAELRQEAAIADPGVTVLGEAVTPRHPSFPNKPLILGGGMVLGAGLGLLLSLILELLNRRLRGVEDLDHLIGAPLLAVIPPQIVVRQPATEKPKAAKRGGGFLPQGRSAASA